MTEQDETPIEVRLAAKCPYCGADVPCLLPSGGHIVVTGFENGQVTTFTVTPCDPWQAALDGQQ